jgi:zinc-ribbon domain
VKRYDVSPGRKIVYHLGQVVIVLGFLLFISTFILGPMEFNRKMRSDDVSGFFGSQCVQGPLPVNGKPVCGSLQDYWTQFTSDAFVRAPVGLVMIIAGFVLMGIGAAGPAGSGLILNPRQARQDLEPLNRAAGGMVQDTLEEIPALQGVLGGQQVIKVRCQNCQALNDETDQFCGQCGKPL